MTWYASSPFGLSQCVRVYNVMEHTLGLRVSAQVARPIREFFERNKPVAAKVLDNGRKMNAAGLRALYGTDFQGAVPAGSDIRLSAMSTWLSKYVASSDPKSAIEIPGQYKGGALEASTSVTVRCASGFLLRVRHMSGRGNPECAS
jgi:hypothetical protein